MFKIFIFIFLSLNLFAYEALIDENSILDIKEIVHSNNFKDIKKDRHSFGYNNHTIWVKKTLSNDTDSTKNIFLKIEPSYLENVEAYIGKVPLKDKNKRIYEVSIKPNEKKDIYFKVESNTNKSVVLNIFNSFREYLNYIEYKSFITDFILFTIIVLFIYNLFVYMFLKQKLYLYYLSYLFFTIIYLSFVVNFLNVFFDKIEFQTLIASIGVNGFMMFILLFISKAINLKLYSKRIYYSFNILIILVILDFLYLVFIDYTLGAKFRALILAPLIFISTFIAILVTKDKEPIVKYLFFGWLAVTLGIALRTFVFLGYIPNNILTENLFFIGVVIEAFMFSLALAYQFDIIQKREIELLKEKQLKDKIIEKQSKFSLAGELLFNIEHEWRRPINQISSITTLIQAKLHSEKEINLSYIKNSIEKIDTSIIDMQNIMENFKKFYASKNQKSKFYLDKNIFDTVEYFKSLKSEVKDIEIELLLEIIAVNSYEQDWRHIILNLLLNSIEATLNKSKDTLKIKIKAYKNQNSYIVEYSDNAGGVSEIDKIFEPFYSTKSSTYSGIGLYMVHQIVTTHLNGTINAQNIKNGLNTTIEISYE